MEAVKESDGCPFDNDDVIEVTAESEDEDDERAADGRGRDSSDGDAGDTGEERGVPAAAGRTGGVLRRVQGCIKEELVPKGIDQRTFFPLMVVVISESVCRNSILSYIGYLIVDVGAASTVDSVGNWTGWVNASFSVCQFLSSFFFGWLSDRAGRKPVLLIGTMGSFLTMFAFGFSRSVWWAIVLRSVNGLLNGNIGTVKTCIAELTTKENRVRAFSYIGLMSGVGNMVGSALGGALARPAAEYPDDFDSSGFWGEYPYALASIVVSVFSLLSFVLTLVLVRETSAVRRGRSARPAEEEGVELVARAPDPAPPAEGRNRYSVKYPATAVGCYYIAATFQTIMMLMISTWTIATVEAGGLGFSPSNVGVLTATSGAAMVVSLLFFVPRVVARLGLLRSIRVGTLCLAPLMLVVPCVNLLARRGGSARTWAWVCVCVGAFFWQSLAQLMMNCTIILVSNSAPPSKVAMANSAGQAFAAVSRAVTPVAVGPLLAWCLAGGRRFPLNHFLPFLINAAIALLYAAITFVAPKSLNQPFMDSFPDHVDI